MRLAAPTGFSLQLLLQPTRVSRQLLCPFHCNKERPRSTCYEVVFIYLSVRCQPATPVQWTTGLKTPVQWTIGPVNSSSASYSVTIAIPLEQPRRSAPAATIASASALLWMPPAALTLQVSPTVCFIRATS